MQLGETECRGSNKQWLDIRETCLHLETLRVGKECTMAKASNYIKQKFTREETLKVRQYSRLGKRRTWDTIRVRTVASLSIFWWDTKYCHLSCNFETSHVQDFSGNIHRRQSYIVGVGGNRVNKSYCMFQIKYFEMRIIENSRRIIVWKQICWALLWTPNLSFVAIFHLENDIGSL